jgi:hypothetical protein
LELKEMPVSTYRTVAWVESSEGQPARRRGLTQIDETRRLFNRARRWAWWRRLWRGLSGSSNALLTSDALLAGATPVVQRVPGVQQVALDQIVGSEGRAHEFDREFGPLQEHTQERWQRVAAAWLAGDPLPPVRLIQVGDRYLVRDGNHRISVARALGAMTVEAVIEQRFVEAAQPRAAVPRGCPSLPG